MHSFFVTIRFPDGARIVLPYQADDFGHAEEQAQPYMERDGEIIAIEKDYGKVA